MVPATMTMDGRLDHMNATTGTPLGENPACAVADTQAAILNALPAHIALLDARGVILEVNEAWRQFAATNDLGSTHFAVGENYLEVCHHARGGGAQSAQTAADGIRRVLHGETDTFTIEYDCHSPDEERWFRLVVTPLRAGGVTGAVLMHTNITEQVQAKAEKEKLFRTLGERVKELRLLHEVSHILQFEDLPVKTLLHEIATLLPSAWQHPEVTAACITFGDTTVATPRFEATPWELSERFATSDGLEGMVRVVYLEDRTSDGEEGLFLEEETTLIRSLAEMLASYFERHQAETKIRHLNRLYAVSSALNAAIVRIQRMEELYECACQIAVEKGGFLMAWVGLVESGGAVLEPVARWSLAAGCCQDEPVSVPDESPGAALAAQAYREGGVACRNDLSQDLRSCPHWEKAVRNGCASAAAFALTSEGRSIGAFVVCAGQPGFFDTEELRLINGLAENLSFAGEARVREEQRRRAELALRASEANMVAAQAIAHFGSWEMMLDDLSDLNANPLHWSDEMFRIAGFEPGSVEVTHEFFFSLVPPEEHALIRQAVATALSERSHYATIHRFIRPDGEQRIIQESARLFCGEETGRLLKLVGTARDITDQRRAEEALHRSNERYEKQHAALTALTRGFALPSTDLDAALREITQTVARTLEVERVSVWRFNADHSSLVCHELFERSDDRHSSGLELQGERYPAYFHAMKENEIISADDAVQDARTREFSVDYLRQLGITSMLDAPIQVRGTLDGVLCSEHVGAPRVWTHDEQTFAISIANLISLLLAQTEQKQAEEKIIQALREKDVLLKEIHHRVKNNLQVISSLLALQSDSLDDPVAQSLLTESQNRVRAMSMIHEKLYQSPTLSRVQFGEYITTLAGFLFRSYTQTSGRVELKLDAEEIHLNIDTAVPCGLILNELISNSLKYAFRDGRRGELRVGLRSAGDGYRLTVADNGVGLPEDFDVRQANSLGLQLVDALSRQIKADLKVDGRGGASFCLDFKELHYAERE